jgi:hypothetical protein
MDIVVRGTNGRIHKDVCVLVCVYAFWCGKEGGREREAEKERESERERERERERLTISRQN